MIYLLAKYALLFLLAAALGFILGYWFSRRNIEDVTESFEDLRNANRRSDEKNWSRLWDRLSAMPEPKETDLSDVHERLDGLSTAVSRLPTPEKPKDVNLQPLAEKLYAIEGAINAIPAPAPQRDVDLQPMNQRLHAIETELASLGKRLGKPAKVESAPRREPREAPRILSAALYGKKDNLRLISGVGPKLEDLLNKNGVYYFWQVAEWNDRDIDIIDERLDAFKGRIGRDDWVSQARRLRAEPGAARMPADI